MTERQLERIEDVSSSNATVKIKFDIAQQPGKIISKLTIKEKSYDRLKIFENTEALIAHYRGHGLLHEVPGEGGIEEIYSKIADVLNHQAGRSC